MNTYYENTLYPLQDKVLKIIDTLHTPFYLTGGTALSRCYFHHRYSDDLDLFVNNHPEFSLHAETIINALKKLHLVVKIKTDTYISLFIEDQLKVELVNDVPHHQGQINSLALFSRVDTVHNILSNKITALYSRNEPKDVVDIWKIATSQKQDWRRVFEDTSSKAAGIFPPLIAERLETFPVVLIDKILWIEGEKPAHEVFTEDISAIILQILQV